MHHFFSINPFTLQKVEEHRPHSQTEVNVKLSQANVAFLQWRQLKIIERAYYILKLAAILRKNKASYAAIITTEMGKPVTEALAEIEKCASTCEYYAANAETFCRDLKLLTEAEKTYVTYQPLGVILAVMPWNFPFWQVFRFAIPTIMAGNTALLKHASNVIGCGKAIESAFVEAEFPDAIFQALTIDNAAVAQLLQDYRIKGVSLTGSEGAGRAVASIAGANLKKSVLELGGSDPFIVLKDADLGKAAEVGIQSRMQNAGQVCISAKRFIVDSAIKDMFIEKMIVHLGDWKPADPTLSSTKMGPMARLDLAETLENQYRETLRQGAVSLNDFYRDNCLVQPILLDLVQPSSTAFREETFGPLVAIITARDEQQALDLANKSSFGLGATIFSQDIEKAEKMGLQLNAGIVFVNAQVRSDPRFPIGGINNSGYGREMSSFGMHEFTNVKTMYIS